VSHQPPDITDVELVADGTVVVKWQVDPILNGDPPDRVEVLVNGRPYAKHGDGDVTVDAATVKASGAAIAIEIDYVWNGSPEQRQAAGIQLPLPSPSTDITPVQVHQRPTLTLKQRMPKTLRQRNSITVTWSAYSVSDADLYWGVEGAAARHVGLRFDATHYGGDFTTDIPLAPAQAYEFKVVVKNSFDGWGPYAAALVVRSASNYSSLRPFLAASGVHGPHVRSALGASGVVSLRQTLGV
jgi:hypothetical protein